MRKLKILEICPFSSGGCGVWGRVRQESLHFASKGYEVRVFSSNKVKGSNKIAPASDKIGNIKIMRFQANKLGGESFMHWNFKDEALEYKPDIIIAHSYRHLHTLKALKVAKRLGAKVFLVTHAPFARERGLINNFIVALYDNTIGKLTINKFDKIISISKWENPYLLDLGVPKSSIIYIPNGIDESFFKSAKGKADKNKIIYTGRITPIKNLELVIPSLPIFVNKEIKLELFGPAEDSYLTDLKNKVKSYNLEKNVNFIVKVYSKEEQIAKLDSARFFILPSKSEGMPQVLIEAMSRGKVVISSDNSGSADLIVDGKNGFLFNNGDVEDLSKKLRNILDLPDKELNSISKNASLFVKQFKWEQLIKKYESLFKLK